MKKFLLLVLSIILIIPTFADSFFEPEWSEFCPRRYENIDSASWHYTSSGKYWANRRKVFEQRLAKCNSLAQDLRGACYQSLRDIETNATQMHTNERGSKALKYMMINSMF